MSKKPPKQSYTRKCDHCRKTITGQTEQQLEEKYIDHVKREHPEVMQ